LMMTYWRHRLGHMVWMLAFDAVVVLPVLVELGGIAGPVDPRILGGVLWNGLLFGAGIIGLEASTGVLQLVFARPVTRAEYVLSRWLAAVIAGVVASSL